MTLMQTSGFLALCLFLLILAFKARGLLRSQASGYVPKDSRLNDSCIMAMIRSGDMVAAMRAYRELHNVTLKEAKARVEAMAQDISGSGLEAERQ